MSRLKRDLAALDRALARNPEADIEPMRIDALFLILTGELTRFDERQRKRGSGHWNPYAFAQHLEAADGLRAAIGAPSDADARPYLSAIRRALTSGRYFTMGYRNRPDLPPVNRFLVKVEDYERTGKRPRYGP